MLHRHTHGHKLPWFGIPFLGKWEAHSHEHDHWHDTGAARTHPHHHDEFQHKDEPSVFAGMRIVLPPTRYLTVKGHEHTEPAGEYEFVPAYPPTPPRPIPYFRETREITVVEELNVETEKQRQHRVYVESFTKPTIRSQEEIDLDKELRDKRENANATAAQSR